MLQHPLGPGTLLVMVCETPLAERLTAVLDELEVAGYTRFSGVSGIGATGRHEGTAVWPGTNTVIFTFVPSSEAVAEILRRNEEIIAETYGRRPGYRAFCLAAEALA
jgi:PII-like signaling protein